MQAKHARDLVEAAVPAEPPRNRRCRCKVAGCGSLARSTTDLCGKHGGGSRCGVASCDKLAQGKSGMCSLCKTSAKAKQQASEEASKPQVKNGREQHAVDEAVGKLTGDELSKTLL